MSPPEPKSSDYPLPPFVLAVPERYTCFWGDLVIQHVLPGRDVSDKPEMEKRRDS